MSVSFTWAWDPFPSPGLPLAALMRICAQYYGSLLCRVQWLSQGEGRHRVDMRERGGWEGLEGVEGRETVIGI